MIHLLLAAAITHSQYIHPDTVTPEPCGIECVQPGDQEAYVVDDSGDGLTQYAPAIIAATMLVLLF